jgi:uncharacterized protein (TIRG00374 family)
LRLGFGVGILALLFWKVGLDAVLRTLIGARPEFVLAASLVFAADRVLMAYKWNILLRAKGILISLMEALRLYTIGNLIGMLTPGFIGLDVYRVAALSSLRRTHDVAATAILERLVGFAALGLIVLAALPRAITFFPSLGEVSLWVIVAISAGGIVGTVVALSPGINVQLFRLLPVRPHTRLGSLLRRTLDSYNDAAADRRTLVRFSVWTVAEVLLSVAVVFLAARALEVDLSFAFFATVAPTIMLVSRLPISPAGLGVAETMYVVALGSAGYSKEYGLALALLVRVMRMVVSQLPAAIWLMLSRPGSQPASREGS